MEIEVSGSLCYHRIDCLTLSLFPAQSYTLYTLYFNSKYTKCLNYKPHQKIAWLIQSDGRELHDENKSTNSLSLSYLPRTIANINIHTVMLTQVEVWENEKNCGITSRRRVLPQLFRVLPNIFECSNNFMETRKESFLFFYKINTQKIFNVFNYRKWLSTNHCARSVFFILLKLLVVTLAISSLSSNNLIYGVRSQ